MANLFNRKFSADESHFTESSYTFPATIPFGPWRRRRQFNKIDWKGPSTSESTTTNVEQQWQWQQHWWAQKGRGKSQSKLGCANLVESKWNRENDEMASSGLQFDGRNTGRCFGAEQPFPRILPGSIWGRGVGTNSTIVASGPFGWFNYYV